MFIFGQESVPSSPKLRLLSVWSTIRNNVGNGNYSLFVYILVSRFHLIKEILIKVTFLLINSHPNYYPDFKVSRPFTKPLLRWAQVHRVCLDNLKISLDQVWSPAVANSTDWIRFKKAYIFWVWDFREHAAVKSEELSIKPCREKVPQGCIIIKRKKDLYARASGQKLLPSKRLALKSF